MERLTWRRVGAAALGLGLLSWGVNCYLARSSSPVPVPWYVSIVLMATAGATLALGWEVKQYKAGNRPGLSPFKAARTAVFAQASALTGAALVGLYGGYVLALIDDWGHPPRRALAASALLAVLAAAALCAAGWVAERWCAIDDDEDDFRPGTVAEAA